MFHNECFMTRKGHNFITCTETSTEHDLQLSTGSEECSKIWSDPNPSPGETSVTAVMDITAVEITLERTGGTETKGALRASGAGERLKYDALDLWPSVACCLLAAWHRNNKVVCVTLSYVKRSVSFLFFYFVAFNSLPAKNCWHTWY